MDIREISRARLVFFSGLVWITHHHNFEPTSSLRSYTTHG
jgi:hypothetical protein